MKTLDIRIKYKYNKKITNYFDLKIKHSLSVIFIVKIEIIKNNALKIKK